MRMGWASASAAGIVATLAVSPDGEGWIPSKRTSSGAGTDGIAGVRRAPEAVAGLLPEDVKEHPAVRNALVGWKQWEKGAPLTATLVTVNVLAFVMQVLTNGGLMAFGMKSNEAIAAGQLYRLVTPIFLHGGIGHLLVNSYALWQVGPMVERVSGPDRYMALYLVSGVAGNVASFAFSKNPSVGASGAIFGVLGGLTVFLFRHKNVLPKGEAMFSTVWQLAALNLLMGSAGGRVDNWGHIGGLVGGTTTAYLLGPSFEPQVGFLGRTAMVDNPPINEIMSAAREARWPQLRLPFRFERGSGWGVRRDELGASGAASRAAAPQQNQQPRRHVKAVSKAFRRRKEILGGGDSD